jgi:indolepyruvate ferredoxin oxidoreductase alpha subunit
MTVAAFRLSHELGMPVMLRSTTRVAHLRGVTEFGPIAAPPRPARMEKAPRELVCLPANAMAMHKKLLARLDAAKRLGNASPFNTVSGPPDAPFGVVANGISAAYVQDALAGLGLDRRVAVFRPGFSYPEPDDAMLAFLRSKSRVLVVEELEPVMETWLKALAQENSLPVTIRGKGVARLSRAYEYDSEMVREAAASFFGEAYSPPVVPELADRPPLPVRPPNLCAGCPHRMTYYAAKKACEGRDVFFPNDIGCYSLGYGAPLQMADSILCMGASASLSCGLGRAVDGSGQQILAFIGDSTFFHSGLTGLANAVFNGHKYTLVILDNAVTAMTGHQPSPTQVPDGDFRFAQAGLTPIDTEAVVRALGVPHVQVVRPANLKKTAAAIREALDYDGLSVIIAREPCPLHHRRHGAAGSVFEVDASRCTRCGVCVNQYGCPAFQVHDTDISIDPAQCSGCAVCPQVCPSRAIRPVKTDGRNTKEAS